LAVSEFRKLESQYRPQIFEPLEQRLSFSFNLDPGRRAGIEVFPGFCFLVPTQAPRVSVAGAHDELVPTTFVYRVADCIARLKVGGPQQQYRSRGKVLAMSAMGLKEKTAEVRFACLQAGKALPGAVSKVVSEMSQHRAQFLFARHSFEAQFCGEGVERGPFVRRNIVILTFVCRRIG